MHLDFEPEVVVESRAKTPTSSTTDGAMIRVGALPVQTRESGFRDVTHAAGQGNNNSSGSSTTSGVLEMGPGQGISGAGERANGHSVIERMAVRVTVVEANGYNPDGAILRPYVILKWGDVEYNTFTGPWSTGSECSWWCVRYTFCTLL